MSVYVINDCCCGLLQEGVAKQQRAEGEPQTETQTVKWEIIYTWINMQLLFCLHKDQLFVSLELNMYVGF